MGSFDRLFPSIKKASRSSLARGVATLGLLLSACEFISYQGVVSADQFSGSGVGVLAVSYDGATVWTRAAVTELAGACGKLSTDSLGNSVAVLAGDEAVEYYADTLASKGTIDLSAIADQPVDIAYASTHLIIASKDSNGSDSLVSIDRFGNIADTVPLDSARAVFVQGIGSPDYRAWWTGRDTDPAQYRVGYWVIENGAVS